MKYGVVYPQIEYPPDPTVIRDYTQAAETLANLLYGSIYTQVAGRVGGHAIDVTDSMTDLVLHGIEGYRRDRDPGGSRGGRAAVRTRWPHAIPSALKHI